MKDIISIAQIAANNHSSAAFVIVGKEAIFVHKVIEVQVDLNCKELLECIFLTEAPTAEPLIFCFTNGVDKVVYVGMYYFETVGGGLRVRLTKLEWRIPTEVEQRAFEREGLYLIDAGFSYEGDELHIFPFFEMMRERLQLYLATRHLGTTNFFSLGNKYDYGSVWVLEDAKDPQWFTTKGRRVKYTNTHDNYVEYDYTNTLPQN